MGVPFPKINLDALALPWARMVQQRIVTLENGVRRKTQSQDNAARAATSMMSTIAGQVATLVEAVATLSGVTATLSALQRVQYSEWQSANGTTTGAVGYLSTPATVTINSPTGRLEVAYGGALNSGNGFIVYGVIGAKSGTVISRETVRNNYAQRVGLSGGASFINSGSRSVVISVPKDETLTVSVEAYSASTTTYFYGASIQARVAP